MRSFDVVPGFRGIRGVAHAMLAVAAVSVFVAASAPRARAGSVRDGQEGHGFIAPSLDSVFRSLAASQARRLGLSQDAVAAICEIPVQVVARLPDDPSGIASYSEAERAFYVSKTRWYAPAVTHAMLDEAICLAVLHALPESERPPLEACEAPPR